MVEATATRLTSTYFGRNSTALGAVGGSDNHALTTAELASHSHPNTLNDSGHSHAETFPIPGGGATWTESVSGSSTGVTTTFSGISTQPSTTGITISNVNAGGGNPHTSVQPTIVCNYIIRII
jgi:microcystin-dependent protein